MLAATLVDRPAGQRRRLATPAPRSASSTTTSATSSCCRRVAPTLVSGGLQREVTTKPSALQLSVATFNVENLAPTDPQTKFDTAGPVRGAQPAGAGHPGAGGDPGQQRRHRRRRGRGRPDDRQADRGDHRGRRAGVPVPRRSTRSTTPTAASRAATSGWCSCSGPTAGCRSSTGRAARRPTATTVARDAAGRPHLSFSPGRIDPTSAAWTDSRKPLAGEFRWRGQTVFVDREPLRLQGRRRPAVRAVPADPAALAGAAGAAGDRGARLRRPDRGGRPERERRGPR